MPTMRTVLLITFFIMFLGFEHVLCDCHCGITPYDYTIENVTVCDAYSTCWDKDVAVHHFCRPGLVFNMHTYACDFPENVECPRRPFNKTSFIETAEKKSKPNQFTDPSECPNPCGIFLYPFWDSHGNLVCRSYLYCAQGEAAIFFCSDGLLYNEELGTCDYAENVNCIGSGTQSTAASTSSSKSPTTSARSTGFTSSTPATTSEICPHGDGNYVFPDQMCSYEYLLCQDAAGHMAFCDMDELFDPETLQCRDITQVCSGKCQSTVYCSSYTTAKSAREVAATP